MLSRRSATTQVAAWRSIRQVSRRCCGPGSLVACLPHLCRTSRRAEMGGWRGAQVAHCHDAFPANLLAGIRGRRRGENGYAQAGLSAERGHSASHDRPSSQGGGCAGEVCGGCGEVHPLRQQRAPGRRGGVCMERATRVAKMAALRLLPITKRSRTMARTANHRDPPSIARHFARRTRSGWQTSDLNHPHACASRPATRSLCPPRPGAVVLAAAARAPTATPREGSP